MKKLFSCVLALLAAVSLYATDLNIYASGLRVTQSAGVTTIDYMLNDTATTLNFKLYNGPTLVTTIPITATSDLLKGAHTGVEIDLGDVADGDYTWALEASAAANGLTGLAEITYPLETEGYCFYLPQDIAVDNSFESPYFGRIYVSESTAGGSDGMTATTKAQTRGIYIYYPTLTFVNGDETALHGYDGNIGGSGRNGFKRIAVDENGYVYVASCANANQGVYRMDPASPSANFTKVLAASAVVNAVGVVGNNLYTAEGLSTTTSGALNTYSLNAIPVGSPTQSLDANATVKLGMTDADMAPDGRGGWWFTQNRWSADGWLCVSHMNSEGVKDFDISSTSGNASLLTSSPQGVTYRGVIAVNPAGNLLAVGSNQKAVVFAISYDEVSGVPSLGEARIYETGVLGSNIDGLAFDVADNLYAASAPKERLYAFATPKAQNTFETPARSANTIHVGSEIHVTGVALDQASASIEWGKTLTLMPTIEPDNATDQSVSWASDNTAVATVSNSGVVTAVAEGSANITVTTTDGGKTATCAVTVYKNAVTDVVVEPTTISLAPGFRYTLKASILPENATFKSYTWASSDEDVATVSSTGLVIALTEGTTTITATSNDDNTKVGSCEVTVTHAVAHISAWDLTVEEVATGYEFSFKANMDATSAALVFYDKTSGNPVGEIAIPSVTEGENTVPVNSGALPGEFNQELKWAVRLTAEDNVAFSKLYESTEETIGRAHVVVDANPESSYMGQVYYTLRTQKTGADLGGLYVFNYIPNQGYTRSDLYTPITTYAEGFMRPALDENGKLWIPDWTDAYSGIYILDPANLNECSQFFQGTRQSSGLFKNGTVEVGGSTPACFLYGEGESRKLFTIQEDFTKSGVGYQPMAIYSIGSAYEWGEGPDTVYTVTPYNKDFSNAIYVVEQGYWISKHSLSGGNGSANPALQFYNMNGECLLSTYNSPYREIIDGCTGSGFTIDPRRNKLYMINASSYILEFDIEYNEGVPSLTLIGKHYVGYPAISSLSVDFAGNLYAAVTTNGTSVNKDAKMRLAVYSPATNGNNTTEVPAKSTSIVKVKATTLYEFDNTTDGDWHLDNGTAMAPVAGEDNVFVGEFTFPNSDSYLTFATIEGADWEAIAPGRISAVAEGSDYWIMQDVVNTDIVRSGYKSFKVPAAYAGKYEITVNLNTMKIQFVKIQAENLYAFSSQEGWKLNEGVAMTKVATNVFETELTLYGDDRYVFFSTTQGAEADDWYGVSFGRDSIVSDGDFWVMNEETEASFTSGNGNNSLKILAANAGTYRFTVNYMTKKINIVRLSDIVAVGEVGYATYYNGAHAYVMPEGVDGYVFSTVLNPCLTLAYEEGEIVPAGTGLVLEAAQGTYELEFTEGGEAPAENQLYGSDVATLTSDIVSGDYKYYGLSLAAAPYNTLTSVGFYFMEEEGAAFTNGAHKAFLAVPQGGSGVAPRFYLFHGENNATGVENIQSDEIQKFMRDGQLYIIRDGVTYDATGRMVK